MEDLQSITIVRQLEWLAVQLRTPVLGPQSAVLSVLALATLLRFLLRPNDTGNRMRGTQSTCKLARSGTRRLQGKIHAESSRTRTCRAQHRQSFFFHRVKSLCLRTGIASTRKTNATKNFCSSYKNYPCYELVAVTAQTILAKSFFGSYGKTILDVNFYSYCNN